MIRELLTGILPLIAPTALYIVWSLTLGKPKPGDEDAKRRFPIAWLALLGALLAAGILVIVIQFGGGGEGTYVPPHISDGGIIPGHTVPAR